MQVPLQIVDLPHDWLTRHILKPRPFAIAMTITKVNIPHTGRRWAFVVGAKSFSVVLRRG